MIKLFKNQDKYLVISDRYGVHSEGNEAQVKNTLRYCFVDQEEIDFAFNEMKQKEHNYADFGINHTLTFTSKKASSPLTEAFLCAPRTVGANDLGYARRSSPFTYLTKVAH